MNEARTDIRPLERAIERLEEGLARYQDDPGDLQIRDGLILRFGFTYELGYKALTRYLEPLAPNFPDFLNEVTYLRDRLRDRLA